MIGQPPEIAQQSGCLRLKKRKKSKKITLGWERVVDACTHCLQIAYRHTIQPWGSTGVIRHLGISSGHLGHSHRHSHVPMTAVVLPWQQPIRGAWRFLPAHLPLVVTALLPLQHVNLTYYSWPPITSSAAEAMAGAVITVVCGLLRTPTIER